ncbi:MAG: sigma-70 family RNA polymerase sigma factor [Smithella sp.]
MDIADLSGLVQSQGRAIYGFCWTLTKNQTDTDDLYQETFLKATQLCHKIDKDQNPKGFLISIAAGLWKNKRRKYARHQKIIYTDMFNENLNHGTGINYEPSPEDSVISNELRIMIQSAADSLSDKLKIPLYMYYTAGMSTEEIASALKIPPGTVKSRLHNARSALKTILEVNGYE